MLVLRGRVLRVLCVLVLCAPAATAAASLVGLQFATACSSAASPSTSTAKV